MNENGAASLATAGEELDAPYDVEYHDTIASTNDRARELAASGASDVVVLASEQTRGRGRRDRGWTGPSGGIYASILLSPDRPTADAPIVTLAAAVATVRACEAVGVDAAIKWPNDVIVEAEAPGDGADRDRGGRKVAGILTETQSEGDRLSWLVVGIGVNANVEPGELPAGATSLRGERGTDVDRRPVARELLEAFAELWADPDAILGAWRDRAATIGRRVRVETPDGTIAGRAVDVVHPGALLVETPAGRRTIHAGECTHLRRVDPGGEQDESDGTRQED
ncbi:MAG: biotin--[acetyl-CoA-carboxylase] ligase [Haloferacaceae archaeon]